MRTEDLLPAARRLLEDHGVDGQGAEDLANVLGGCFFQTLHPGSTLCEEGQKGDDMFFLLEGAASVLKKDFLGVPRELTTLRAPSLFGHMSLVDGSPRSATCRVAEPGLAAVMHRPLYNRVVADPGPQGDWFRRLMIAAMSRQLARGNDQLQALLRGKATPSGGDAAVREGMFRASVSYDGWEPKG